MITPAERRLYFRTAAEHMACGCPMLALEVLSRLPRNLSLVTDNADSVKLLLGEDIAAPVVIEKAEDFDWGAGTAKVEVRRSRMAYRFIGHESIDQIINWVCVKEEEFKYEWSDDDDELDEYGEKIPKEEKTAESVAVTETIADDDAVPTTSVSE